MENYVNWREKIYKIKKNLIALKIVFIKLLFLTFSFVLKCNLDSFLKAYMRVTIAKTAEL